MASGRLKKPEKIWEAIGRIKERYPRVARYYSIERGETGLKWEENAEKKAIAEALDGAYLLKTDRTDLGTDEAWRVYSMLTRAESAFRAMKSPLSERPIFHSRQRAERLVGNDPRYAIEPSNSHSGPSYDQQRNPQNPMRFGAGTRAHQNLRCPGPSARHHDANQNMVQYIVTSSRSSPPLSWAFVT